MRLPDGYESWSAREYLAWVGGLSGDAAPKTQNDWASIIYVPSFEATSQSSPDERRLEWGDVAAQLIGSARAAGALTEVEARSKRTNLSAVLIRKLGAQPAVELLDPERVVSHGITGQPLTITDVTAAADRLPKVGPSHPDFRIDPDDLRLVRHAKAMVQTLAPIAESLPDGATKREFERWSDAVGQIQVGPARPAKG